MLKQLELRLVNILFQICSREKHLDRLLQKMMKLGILILRAEGACFFLPVKWTNELVLYTTYSPNQLDFSITGRELSAMFAKREAPWQENKGNLLIPLYVNDSLYAVICYVHISAKLQGDSKRLLDRIVYHMNQMYENRKIQMDKDDYHAALVDISHVITYSEDFDDVVTEAIEMASEVAGGSCGIILLTKDKQHLIPIYTNNVAVEDMAQFSYPPLPGQDQTAYLAITEKRVVFVEDTANNPLVNEKFCKKYGVKSSMIFPLHIHDQELGALYVDYAYHRNFSKQEITFFKELSQQISHVVYNLQARNELLQTKRAQDQIVNMMRLMTNRVRLKDVIKDMANQTYQILGKKVGVSVWLINQTRDKIKLSAWQGDEVRLDAKKCKEFSIEEMGNAALLQDSFLEPDPKSEMGQFFMDNGLPCSIGTPLMAGKEFTGILFLHGLEGHVWTEQEKLTLTAIGIHSGPIIRHGQYIHMLEKESKLDGLTKVYNRQHFEKTYKEYSNQHLRKERPFTLLMMDLDNFKHINDQYGHLIGDKVMRSVARILLDTIRRTDKAFRYGGEEFAVLLTGTGKEEAEQVAERIRANIEEAQMDPPVTVSIGLATFLEHAKDADEVIKRADLALYTAKSKGKNRVVIAR